MFQSRPTNELKITFIFQWMISWFMTVVTINLYVSIHVCNLRVVNRE